VEPNDVGLQQFYEYQTSGKYKHEEYGRSKVVDDYFFVLKEGKHKFDILVSEYQQMYQNGEWYGFYQLHLDWKGDLWLLKHILKWHKSVPEWVCDENFDIERRSLVEYPE
jgi:hypothetical protein